MMSKIKVLIVLMCFVIRFLPVVVADEVYKPFKLGYSISLNKINKEELANAKKAGIEYIEISGLGSLIDKETRQLNLSTKELKKRMAEIKAIADEEGIKIWSLHMPYGKEEDISVLNEVVRKQVVDIHKQIIKQAIVLNPQIILFHPSWYLGLNEREERIQQLIKSVEVLNKEVKEIGAKMVIENMLGPKLLKSAEQERPLCRSVEETIGIMDRLPKDVFAAVDMNHIKSPEKLVLALGNRLKSVHIADGDGLGERHYFPCSGEGKNDWNAIISALYKVGYEGAFMYESKYPSLEAMRLCYETIHRNFISNTK